MSRDSTRTPGGDSDLSRVGRDGNELSDVTGLAVSPESDAENDAFSNELRRTLEETTQDLLGYRVAEKLDPEASWQRVRTIIEEFRPVPSFIWRLSNFVLGRPGATPAIGDGMVFGLRRLLFAVASDPLLSGGQRKVNDVRRALATVSSDVIAAAAVIHAVCRRLSSHDHERIWRPLLDDALRRAQIGVHVGSMVPEFGAGRGMLAGFAGRIGVIIQIATGSIEQARRALELLATGEEIGDVGLKLYGADPLQVSAMLLSAAGCGREAAVGTASYASHYSVDVAKSEEQARWLAAFTLIEHLRMDAPDQISPEGWKVFQLDDPAEREKIIKDVRELVRRGHRWEWLT